MKLPLPLPRRRAGEDRESGARRLPDPGKVPTARGTWEEAALTNVDITELVKQQIRTQTKPWMK